MKERFSAGRAPACPSSMPGSHPGAGCAMAEEILHETLLGYAGIQAVPSNQTWSKVNPHGVPTLEYQLLSPPACFC